jgi:hypothetical protein
MEGSKLRDGSDHETGLLIAASRRLCGEAASLCARAGETQQELHEVLASVRNTAHVALLRQHLERKLGRGVHLTGDGQQPASP